MIPSPRHGALGKGKIIHCILEGCSAVLHASLCTSSNFHLSHCFFLLSVLTALCLPLSSTPPSQRVPGGGRGAHAGRQQSLVQTGRGADGTSGMSWERTCCRCWPPAVQSSPTGAHRSQGHDPASRHSSPLPPPLLSFPGSSSSPPPLLPP